MFPPWRITAHTSCTDVRHHQAVLWAALSQCGCHFPLLFTCRTPLVDLVAALHTLIPWRRFVRWCIWKSRCTTSKSGFVLQVYLGMKRWSAWTLSKVSEKQSHCTIWCRRPRAMCRDGGWSSTGRRRRGLVHHKDGCGVYLNWLWHLQKTSWPLLLRIHSNHIPEKKHWHVSVARMMSPSSLLWSKNHPVGYSDILIPVCPSLLEAPSLCVGGDIAEFKQRDSVYVLVFNLCLNTSLVIKSRYWSWRRAWPCHCHESKTRTVTTELWMMSFSITFQTCVKLLRLSLGAYRVMCCQRDKADWASWEQSQNNNSVMFHCHPVPPQIFCVCCVSADSALCDVHAWF